MPENLDVEPSEDESLAQKYRRVIRALFTDLLHIRKAAPEIFTQLYHNRTSDIAKIKDILRRIRQTGDNILITGDAGVGKSTYVYRVLEDSALKEQAGIYPIIADYRETMDRDALLLDFVDEVEKYFEVIDQPIHTLKDNNVDNLKANRTSLIRHLKKLKLSGDLPYPVVFLDDFDYIEDHLFPTLEWFLSFAVSERCSIVLTARPPLFNSTTRHDDHLSAYFFRNVRQVKLKPIPPDELIESKLAIILDEDSPQHFWLQSRIAKKDALTVWLRKMDIKDAASLEKLKLPFDETLYNFMRSVTNGNIREILRIADTCLNFILSHMDSLEDVYEDFEGERLVKKHVSLDKLLDLFAVPGSEPDDIEELPPFRLLNLHHDRSPLGNSLLFNVLEGIQNYRKLSEEFFLFMKKLGHSDAQVRAAIHILEGKSHRLIEPTGIFPPKEKVQLSAQYRLTEKGEYYLGHIVRSDAYRRKFGQPGESLRELLKG